MGRMILAVLVGAAVWAMLWVGGAQAAQAAFPELLQAGQPVTHTGALAGYVLYSVLLSILGGYVTAAVASRDPMRAVWALAVVQLALGIGIEVSAWNLAPAWYHLVFLALLVPAMVYGGRLRVTQGRAREAFSS